jgi:dTDP-4-amino-4,6-dideoxygalactose transaminase
MASIGRDTLCRILAAENVIARRYFSPGCHRSSPYNAREPGQPLAVTERLSRALLQLPTGLQLTPADAHRIAELISFICAHGEPLEAALAKHGVK